MNFDLADEQNNIDNVLSIINQHINITLINLDEYISYVSSNIKYCDKVERKVKQIRRIAKQMNKWK